MASIESLRQAVQMSPDDAPLLLMLADACMDDLLFAEARQVYDRVLALDADHLDARVGVARVLLLEGRGSEAAVRLEALLSQHPRHIPARVLLSRIELGEGNRRAALEHYRRAREIDPSSHDIGLELELGLTRANATGTTAGDASGGTRPAGSRRDAQRAPRAEHGNGSPENDPARDPLASDTEDSDADDTAEEDEIEEDAPRESAPDKADPPDAAPAQDPAITFDDIGGMEPLKEAIRMRIIHPIHHADLLRAYRRRVGGGVLLYGPPGCGKTMFAHAIAGELGARLVPVSFPQVLEMWLHNRERTRDLHQILELARDSAPLVLLVEGIDTLLTEHYEPYRAAIRALLNQLLDEFDPADRRNDALLVIGATSAPWNVDPAFRRAGRFDRSLFIPPPDEPGRAEIIRLLARDRPVSALDERGLARRTAGFTGRDLERMFDLATERILERALRERRLIPITTDDLRRAARALRPSTRAWLDTARGFVAHSNPDGLYDGLRAYLGIKPPPGPPGV